MREFLRLLSILCFAVFFAKKTSAQSWSDGYYLSNNACIKWNPAWLTWSDSVSWNECQPFMKHNATNQNWEFWAYGQFYSNPLQVCQSWGTSCIGLCMYQNFWFQCPFGQVLDLKTRIWVDNCNLNYQILINNTVMRLKNIWNFIWHYFIF